MQGRKTELTTNRCPLGSWAATRPREAGVPSSRASPRHGEVRPTEVLTARHGRSMLYRLSTHNTVLPKFSPKSFDFKALYSNQYCTIYATRRALRARSRTKVVLGEPGADRKLITKSP